MNIYRLFLLKVSPRPRIYVKAFRVRCKYKLHLTVAEQDGIVKYIKDIHNIFKREIQRCHTHTHTHTHIYIYI